MIKEKQQKKILNDIFSKTLKKRLLPTLIYVCSIFILIICYFLLLNKEIENILFFITPITFSISILQYFLILLFQKQICKKIKKIIIKRIIIISIVAIIISIIFIILKINTIKNFTANYNYFFVISKKETEFMLPDCENSKK